MRFVFGFILVACIGCNSPKIVFDYDDSIAFNSFKTYNFYEDVGKGLQGLDSKRIQSTLKKALDSLGFTFETYPSFYINFEGFASEDLGGQNVGVMVGGASNHGIGISGGISFGRKKIRQTIVITFVNASTNRIIWEGEYTEIIPEKLLPEQRDEFYRNVVYSLLSKYPPRTK